MSEKDILKNEGALLSSINTCPIYRLLGMEAMEARNGRARVKLPFKEDLTHPGKIVHGGAIASVADSALALALLSLTFPKNFVTTVEMKLNYLAPVDRGEMIAEGRVVKKGKTFSLVEVEVTSDEGKLIAKGLATFYMI